MLRAATTRLPENPLAQAALAIAGAACGDHEVARSAAERVDALGGADAAFAILRSDAQRSLMVRGLAMAHAARATA